MKWLAAILATLSVLVLVPVFTMVQLSSPEAARGAIERMLRAELPPLDGGAESVVRLNLDYAAGEDLELIPGTGVTVGPDEISEAQVDELVVRVAEEMSGRIVAEGAPALLAEMSDEALVGQLGPMLESTGVELVRSGLLLALLPSGLDNGSRLANWQLQAQQNPGEEVQPIVGIFVTVPPGELADLEPRAIGVRVVDILADRLFERGLEATLELVSNANLRTLLQESALGPVQENLRDLLVAALSFRSGELQDRLDQARAIVAARAGSGDTVLPGVLSEVEAADLTPQQARELVVERLAERGQERGAVALLEAIDDEALRARVAASSGIVDALAVGANERYRRWTWLASAFAVVMMLLLVAASRGWGRLANPGFVFVVAAALGSLLGLRLSQWAAAGAVDAGGAPVSLAQRGIAAVVAFLAADVFPEALELWVRNHLAVLIAGAALLVLALSLRLFRAVRPRRRSLL